MKKDDIIIVGGGLSGLSTAYHLARQGIEPIVIEAGKIGIGTDEMLSGTNGPRLTKMIVISYEGNAKLFYERIGKEKSKRFLNLMIKGADLEVELAKSLDSEIVRQNGSIIVEMRGQKRQFNDEIEKYPTKIKKGCRQVSIDELVQIYGVKRTAFHEFHSGIFMPNDATIDCNRYIRLLAQQVQKMGGVIIEKVKVKDVKQNKNGVEVKTDKAGDCKVNYVVMATNGFFVDENLKGLLRPEWSYMLSYEDGGENTPNAWQFIPNTYHYWVRNDNVLSIGGEDKAFERNHPRASRFHKRALKKLDKWAQENFPKLMGKKPIEEHYGVFASTLDEIPIVGNVGNIFYIVGCNGSGQNTLSYGAYLLPGLMGYRKLSAEEKEYVDLLSIKRASLKT